jgi:hypothetical protein
MQIILLINRENIVEDCQNLPLENLDSSMLRAYPGDEGEPWIGFTQYTTASIVGLVEGDRVAVLKNRDGVCGVLSHEEFSKEVWSEGNINVFKGCQSF